MIVNKITGGEFLPLAFMADGVEGGVQPQEPAAAGAFEEPELETVYVEGVDDIPETEPGPDPDEILQQNQQLQQQLEQLKTQVDPVQSLQQGLASLGEQLQQPRKAEPQQQQIQQQPGETEEQFAERLKEKFYDDPYSMLNEFQYRKLQPLVAQMVNNNLANSRRFLYVDPGKKENAARYQDEIEQEVSGMNYQEKMSDPDVYGKAYERVIARHVDDIVEQRVKAQMEQMQSAASPALPPTPSSEGSTYRPQGGKPKTVKKLTQQEARDAFNKGIPKDQYYDYLVRKGLKK